MATSSWINMLLKMIESRGHSQDGEGSSIDLTTQILSLRLLSTILPHSKLDMGNFSIILHIRNVRNETKNFYLL